jgi:rod shape-determining protein MreB and related proteins
MRQWGLFKAQSFAIDLGNNNTIVTDVDNMLLSQRSCIVFNRNNNSIKAVGDAAFDMFEKTHEELQTVLPLKGGVIADYESASKMIRELVRRIYTRSWLHKFDNIISGVPYYTTDVERRALWNALDQFNSHHTYLVYEPLAAALGLGLNIQEPEGKLVIDIGGGITEIVAISLSGIAAFKSLKTAGDSFDLAIQDHFRKTYSMIIGLKTAEQVKIRAGAVCHDIGPEAPLPVTVKGKDIITGLPIQRKIGYEEVADVLDRPMRSIEDCIVHTLETCPPELSADICQHGVYVTGGGALLRGLRQRFEKKTGLRVHIDSQPMFAVSKGIASVLKETKRYRSVLLRV